MVCDDETCPSSPSFIQRTYIKPEAQLYALVGPTKKPLCLWQCKIN